MDKVLTTIYRKSSYLYDELEFHLYLPLSIEIVEQQWNRDGTAKKVEFLNDSGEREKLFINPHNVWVKSFEPSSKHMLESEYIPVMVRCRDAVSSCYPRVLHEQCEVLLQKRGGYTQVRCLHCGRVSPLAINSLCICTEDYEFEHRCSEI